MAVKVPPLSTNPVTGPPLVLLEVAGNLAAAVDSRSIGTGGIGYVNCCEGAAVIEKSVCGVGGAAKESHDRAGIIDSINLRGNRIRRIHGGENDAGMRVVGATAKIPTVSPVRPAVRKRRRARQPAKSPNPATISAPVRGSGAAT